ncbi:MFS family permease [Catenulispora sp. EB89]|uniref:MFS transporter n=1 Tax=Catenulispora sp. EB89 TaxID=3156257 RepID=UPI003517ED00
MPEPKDPAPAGGTPGPRRSLLARNRDFRWFWGGQTVSVVGAQVTAVALPLTAAITLDAGPGAVGAIAAATYLPNVAFPLFAGHWIEKCRRRPVMIGADVARAVLVGAVPVAYLLHHLSLALLAAVAFGVGGASVVFDVASFAYLPDLVGEQDLGGANQAMQGSTTAAQVSGPGLAGLTVQLAGPALAMVVNAASYVGSVVGIAAGRSESRPPPGQSRKGLLEGVRQLLANPYLRGLTAHAALYNVGSQMLTVNLVIWLTKVRHTSVGVYGLALSATGAGAFVGTMGVLRLMGRVGFGRAYAGALLLFAGLPLALAALPFSGNALGAAVAAVEVVAGVGLGAANVLSTTLRQAVIPRGALARSIGGYRMLIFGVIPLGGGLGGAIGQVFGARTGVAAGTAAMALSALPMLGSRIRALRSPGDARLDQAVSGAPALDGTVGADRESVS